MLEPIRTSTNPEHDNRAVLPIKFDRPCLIYCKKPKASKSIITNNLYFSEASRKDPKEDVKTRCANEPPPHHLPLLPAHQRLLVLEKQKERKETQPRKKTKKMAFFSYSFIVSFVVAAIYWKVLPFVVGLLFVIAGATRLRRPA